MYCFITVIEDASGERIGATNVIGSEEIRLLTSITFFREVGSNVLQDSTSEPLIVAALVVRIDEDNSDRESLYA